MWKPTVNYCGYVPPASSDELYHSAKGSSWKKHKYIAIKNGKYIYPSTDTGTGDAKEVARRQSLHKQAKNKGYSLSADRAIKKAQERARQSNSTIRTNTINGKHSTKIEDHSIWGPSGNKYQAEENSKKRSQHFSDASSSEKHYADNWRDYQDGKRSEANKSRRKAKGYKTAAKSADIRAKQWAKYIERTDKKEIGRWNNKQAEEAGEYKETLKKKGTKVKNKTAKKNQLKAKVEKAKYKVRSTMRKGKKKLKKITNHD